ncbi:phosphoglycerate mutase [Gluconacetobacter azotocaptans]|uniref:Phosphoglycerate mutase n=1 Tax=Gluconacetobacter azotocaptans TaxID=142834 RepID=A0A7W4JQF2_9PROT|nr:histidine phosphatase family protein [Gluconacetobacter azotocaptans]MBB2189019.1 phosphoglycerate mutase [Gluconacetobacter azotocaptans]GBQ26653.1 phosphoglycerate mutase [Gluconacetobacter azotocaptans DSM 13594]
MTPRETQVDCPAIDTIYAPLAILLTRHPPVAVPAGTCYGRHDVALLPGWRGRADGLAVLARGAGCRVIHASPASRCRQVAERIAARAGIALRVDPRLAELDFGAWEGQSWDSIDRATLDAWAADPEGFAPPGGEAGRGLLHRVQSFWHDMLAQGAPACVLSHGGPLRLMEGLAAGRRPALLDPVMRQGGARLYAVPCRHAVAEPGAISLRAGSRIWL